MVRMRCESGCLWRYQTGGCGCAQWPAAEHPLFSPAAVFKAYRHCRRRKRGTANAIRFETDLEANIFDLSRELVNGTYRPGRSVVFLVRHPKAREILAADFRDRVVHHLLVGHLEPYWERRFIHDSHACRRGRGIHLAVDRLRSFCRKATANETRDAWYLQLDIKGFFMNINRRLLFDRLASAESDPHVVDLLRTVVFHEPIHNCVFKGCTVDDCRALPPHKTLFHAAPGCGLPIGNLTSQFFANVYLDALDQFIKHELRCRFYLRYCDDFVLLSPSREQLQHWQCAIETFLHTRLRLVLNEKRKLRPISDGIDFLGYIVRPAYTLVRKRVVNNFKKRLWELESRLSEFNKAGSEAKQLTSGELSPSWKRPFGYGRIPVPANLVEWTRPWLQSYLGHFSHATSHRLICSAVDAHPALSCWFRSEADWQPRFPLPSKPPTRLTAQLCGFRQLFRHYWLFVQFGNVWRVYPPRSGMHLMEPLGIGSWFFEETRCYVVSVFAGLHLPQAWFKQTNDFNGFIHTRNLQEIWQ